MRINIQYVAFTGIELLATFPATRSWTLPEPRQQQQQHQKRNLNANPRRFHTPNASWCLLYVMELCGEWCVVAHFRLGPGSQRVSLSWLFTVCGYVGVRECVCVNFLWLGVRIGGSEAFNWLSALRGASGVRHVGYGVWHASMFQHLPFSFSMPLHSIYFRQKLNKNTHILNINSTCYIDRSRLFSHVKHSGQMQSTAAPSAKNWKWMHR